MGIIIIFYNKNVIFRICKMEMGCKILYKLKKRRKNKIKNG